MCLSPMETICLSVKEFKEYFMIYPLKSSTGEKTTIFNLEEKK